MILADATDWLKTTVLGIVILGAIGSMVCFCVLKIAGGILHRLNLAMFNYVGSRASVGRSVIEALIVQDSNSKAFFWVVANIVSFNCTSLFCIMMFIVDIIYFGHFGISNAFVSSSLLTIHFLSVYETLRLFSYLAPIIESADWFKSKYPPPESGTENLPH